MSQSISESEIRTGVFAAILSYLCWGAFGLYFKSLDAISPVEILTHRIVWSAVLLLIVISALKKWPETLAILTNYKQAALFLLSAILVSINWGVYIYAVVTGQALEGSMGYFILPLVAVLMGAVFFAERFALTQIIAICLAALGVIIQIVLYGKFPWIALTLATSFGFYGMIRKKAPADSMVGLLVETLLISPFALACWIYWSAQGSFAFISADFSMMGLMVLAGPVTAIPLVLFAYGAKRLRYSTVGLLQYVNPTCQFLIAIFIFKEGFEADNLITFGFIWAGLILYSLHTLKESRKKKKAIS